MDFEKRVLDASGFVLFSEYDPSAIQDIRYFSNYNFVGDRIDGYEQPVALLTKEAALALKEVSDEMREKGFRLKIFDAYRPSSAVRHFLRWGNDENDLRMKRFFYPDLEKRAIFERGFIANRSSHSRGSTVDLTLFDLNGKKDVDMGSPFDFFGEISYSDYSDITQTQFSNRLMLKDAMMKHGFLPLECEWWHFTLKDEPFPDTYFDFPVNADLTQNRI